MKQILIILSVLALNALSYGQSDTLIIKSEKGFLFLSNYNYLYDESNSEDRPIGFHDFFFPSKCLDIKCFLDKNMSLGFRNGVRVEYFKSRNYVKNKSTLIKCIDTSQCYEYDKFYIIPIEIDYRIYQDNFPFVCRRNFYMLQVIGGAKLHFEYQHKAVIPIRIRTLLDVKKN